jgi:hypothetical protein
MPWQAQSGAGVALEVDDARDLQKINYAQQGDATLYSQDMLTARHSLRSSPQASHPGGRPASSGAAVRARAPCRSLPG